jgi:hypothetical protein
MGAVVVKESFGLDVILGMNEMVRSGAQLCPWTRLGHTYNSKNPGSHVCPTGSIIIDSSTVGVHSITANDDCLGCGKTPVRPLDEFSHEICQRVDDMIRERPVGLFMSITSLHDYDWKG